MSYYSSVPSRLTKPRIPGREAAPDAGNESKTIAVPRQRARHPKPDEAGSFAADIASFRLYLAVTALRWLLAPGIVATLAANMARAGRTARSGTPWSRNVGHPRRRATSSR